MTPMTKGQLWQRRILAKFPLEDTDPLRDTVRLAAESVDRAAEAQASIEEHGLLVEGLHGPKANPAVAIKRDAVAEFLRLSRALGIHDPETAS
jgi:phage terminase small subunit